MDVQREAGIYKDVSNNDYHAGPGISSSVIRTAISCPFKAWVKHFSGMEVKNEPTESMKFGTASHTFILEPELFHNEYVVAPKIDRRKKEYKEWAAEQTGKEILKEADMQKLTAMRDAIMNHPIAKNSIKEGEAESSCYAEDRDTGLLIKSRPDFRTENFILDYKTCTDASLNGFSRSIANYGYHMQAAHYLHVEELLTGNDHATFIFLAQETTAPYAVAIYVLDIDAIALGRAENKRGLASIAELMQSDVAWPSYNDNDLKEIGLPYWMTRSLENE